MSPAEGYVAMESACRIDTNVIKTYVPWYICRKDQPVTWSAVAKSDHVDIITSQCEAYVFTNPVVEPDYEEIPWQHPGSEYEIPITKCPAYVATSQQREKTEEDAYETV